MEATSIQDKVLVIGPSHVVILEYFIKNKVLPDIRNEIDFVGISGCPIWHDKIISNLDLYVNYKKVIFIVGDFRFGNGVLEDSPKGRTVGIEKKLINNDNDLKLYQRSMGALSLIRERLEGKVKFVFWDLILRENRNRLNGFYYESGCYKHPIWNYEEIQYKFADCSIDFTDVISLPSLLSFYVDSSNHPSILGYALFYKIFFDVLDEITCVSKSFLEGFILAASSLHFPLGKKVAVIGDVKNPKESSSFVQVANSYFKKKITSLPNLILSRTFISEGLIDRGVTEVIVVSSLDFNSIDENYKEVIEHIASLNNILKEQGVIDVKWLFWECSIKDLIFGRDSKLSEVKSELLSQEVYVMDLELDDGFLIAGAIEKNKVFPPSLLALICFFNSVLSASDKFLMHYTDYNLMLSHFFENTGLELTYSR